MLTLVIAAVGVLAIAIVLKGQSDPTRAKNLQDKFDAAQADARPLDKMLLRGARRVAQLPYVHLPEESRQYEYLRNKLAAAGNLYGGSVAVFLSVQVTAVLTAALVAVGLVASGVSGLNLLAVTAVVFGVGAYPYAVVSQKQQARVEAVLSNLPDFAEMLLLHIVNGSGIFVSLKSTAAAVRGPVSTEVAVMLEAIELGAITEEEAFSNAGKRLGGGPATHFFNTLSQAYLQGTPVSEALSDQSEHLRKLEYEHRRKKLKSLPGKLTLITAVHLMPALFMILGVPVFFSLAGVSQ